MILEDFTAPIKNPDRVVKEVYDTFDHAKLDVVLAECCAGVIRGQQMDSQKYGMVGACVVDEKDRLVFGINYLLDDGTRVHAERAAIEKYIGMYGRVPYNSIIVTTCSPCSGPMHDRHGDSCTQFLDDYGIRRVYTGFEDPTQNDTVLFNNRTFDIAVTDNQKLRDLCRRFADTFLKHQELDEGWKQNVASLTAAGALALGGTTAYKHDVGVNQQAQAVATTSKEVKSAVLNNAAAQDLARIAKAAGMRGDEFAQFMAQCAVETGNFTNFTELGKNHKKYEPGTKMGKILGNKVKGDGERYKGRGFIQLTGRENYQRASKALGIDLINHPELLDKPDIAAKVAVWYWQSKVQPRVDDFKDTRQVTKPINGGLKHLKHRDDKYKEFKSAQLAEEQVDEILKLPVGDYGKKGTLTPMKEPKNAKELPGGAGYKYVVQGDDNRKEILLFVDGNLAAELDIYRAKAPIPLWSVEAVVAEPEYQGKGLAMALYGIALSILKLTLKAGDSQTINGQRQWLKLAQIPGVEVKGITSVPTSEYKPREGQEVLWTRGKNTVHTFSVGQGNKSMRSGQRGVGLYGNEESSMIAKWTGK